MKKNKIGTIAVASVVSLALLSGGVYAWFVSQKVAAAVDVSTGDIQIAELQPLTGDTNMVPGDILVLNQNDPAKIENTGSRNAIVELSWEDENFKAFLDPAKISDAMADTHASDYDASTGQFTAERTREVIKAEFIDAVQQYGWDEYTDATTGETKFYKVVDSGDTEDIGLIELEILGELGGLAYDDYGQGPSDDRQYEQGSTFEVAYTAKAVQATEGAVADYLGQDVASHLAGKGMYDSERP